MADGLGSGLRIALVSKIRGTGLRVNLGCGPDVRDGWVNIDSQRRPGVIRRNLARGLPLAPGSCAAIYSSHFLEHLRYEAVKRLLADAHRALEPGGVFRAALPDVPALFDAYRRGDAAFFNLLDIRSIAPWVDPGTETLIDYVNYGAYQSGEHKYIYDAEKLCAMLTAAWFTDVSETGYDPAFDPSDELRRRYSFYVQATR